jgi:predicted dehydrogenase
MNLLVVGSGDMSAHHCAVLSALGHNVTVIGRGERSADAFRQRTGIEVRSRNLHEYLASAPTHDAAFVAVTVENLSAVTTSLAEAGIRRILVEKPGASSVQELEELAAVEERTGARIRIGYNRRFYGSVLAAKAIIATDGGILSSRFEFTEWPHQIEPLPIRPEIKAKWVIANSSHVIDLVFHLAGDPAILKSHSARSISWHPSAGVFVGHGETVGGSLFSYHSNWCGPGRWSCEFVTAEHRLLFQPMETLQIMKRGSVAMTTVDEDDCDRQYKPGLFRQNEQFLSDSDNGLCTLREQISRWHVYSQIANYQQ